MRRGIFDQGYYYRFSKMLVTDQVQRRFQRAEQLVRLREVILVQHFEIARRAIIMKSTIVIVIVQQVDADGYCNVEPDGNDGK